MKHLRVCIVPDPSLYEDLEGSAGTPFLGLALTLAEAGHTVDFLDPWADRRPDNEKTKLRRVFRDKGLELIEAVPAGPKAANSAHGRLAAAPFAVYEALKGRSYDLVHATDCGGVAYYYQQAAKLGLISSPADVWIHVSAPYLYLLEIGQERIESYSDTMRCFLERRSAELGDELIARSAPVRDWMVSAGYDIDPDRTRIDPGLTLPVPPALVAADRSGPVPVERIVFAGRMNHAGGLTTACYMLREIASRGVKLSSVLFTGPEDPNFEAGTFLKEITAGLPYRWRHESRLSREALLTELAKPGTLAIFPSNVDERSLVLQECIALGVPCLTSHAGEVPTLAGAEDASQLIPPHYLSFADAVAAASAQGIERPSGKVDVAANRAVWLAWHADRKSPAAAETASASEPSEEYVTSEPWEIRARARDAQAAALQPQTSRDAPFVSVCIAHFNRPETLRHTLQSLNKQTFDNFEIIVVDDGSGEENRAALSALLKKFPKARAVFQRNLYLGATRNTGARHARGKYLLFMDDDNCAKPHEIELFVSIAERCPVDILVCFSDNFTGEGAATPDKLNGIRRLPFGPDLVYGLMRNGYGDSNCFVRRDVWAELGGFTEDYRVGLDDHEFFTRATLAGFSVDVVPEALYFYRLAEQKMKRFHPSKRANVVRILEPYLKSGAVPPDFLPMLYAMRGFYERLDENGLMQPAAAGRRTPGEGKEKNVPAKKGE